MVEILSGAKAQCRCECGTERAVAISNLVANPGSRSCGCLKRERTSETHRKHGVGYSDYRYLLWRAIKGKCLRPSHQDFQYYGGRGITMYEPWITDFPAFAAWIDGNLGERPDGFTMDRINNDGNYEPGNLRWASRRTQALNRRSRWRNEKE